MLKDFFRAVKKIYLCNNIVLWMILFVLPVSTSIFMVHFFSAESIQRIPIGIIHYDYSKLSERLEYSLSANPVLDLKLHCSDFSECERGIRRGEIQAFIVIPYQFEKRVLRYETPVVPIYSNGQYYLTNMFALKEIRSVFSTIGSNLFTRHIKEPIKTEIHSVGNSTGNYQGYLGLGLVTSIFHMSSILIAVYVFSFPLRDRKTKEYIDAAGGSRMILWFASVVPLILISWFLMLAVYTYTHRFLAPLTLNEFIMVGAGQLAMVLACTGAGISFVGITGNMRMATSVAGVIGGPAFAFAGQTFPIIAMPFFVRCFAFLLPLTHLLKIQSQMILGDVGLIPSWDSLVILLGMGLFWHLLGGRFMFMRWKKWNHD